MHAMPGMIKLLLRKKHQKKKRNTMAHYNVSDVAKNNSKNIST